MTTTEPLTDGQLRAAWHALDVSSAALRRRIHRHLHKYTGLPLGWADVLLTLADAPDGRQPMHIAAAQTGLTSGGFTKLADRMQHAGLLVRDHSTGDRRIVYLALTDHGRDKATETAQILADVLRRQLGNVTRHDLGLLTDTLRSVQHGDASHAGT